MSYSKEKATALQAVRVASQLTSAIRETLLKSQVAHKDDNSPVTIADFSAQAIICKMLHDIFPDDSIIAEEDSEELKKDSELLTAVTLNVNKVFHRASPKDVCDWIDLGQNSGGHRFWTLDPIDGTLGFLREDGQFVNALALVEDNQFQVGVFGCSALEGGTIITSERGAGNQAFTLDLQDLPFNSVQINQRLIESLEGSANTELHAKVAQELGLSQEPLRLDSQIKYLFLARGRGSVYLRLPKTPGNREKIWDHASMLIVQEAGGTVTDQNGKPFDLTTGRFLQNNTGIVATRGINHQQVLQAIQKFS